MHSSTILPPEPQFSLDRFFEVGTDGVLRYKPWVEYQWLEHGFGTRLSPEWNCESRWVTLNQIHSANAIRVDPQRKCGRAGDGDILLTDVPGMGIGVRTADCVPVLLVDPVRRAAAAVHGGWRGLAAGVVEKAVKAMQEHFGSRAAELEAAVGPGARACCYEVGAEIVQRFSASEYGQAIAGNRIDLVAVARGQLLAEGLQPGNIGVAGLCTICRPGLFWSYRREGTRAGRMISGVRLRQK